MPTDVGNIMAEESHEIHPTLYLPDGDIALSALKPIPYNCFQLSRLDKVLLSQFSPVFKDLFSLPLHPEANEIYEGAPIVHLSDPAEELEPLLALVYGQSAPPGHLIPTNYMRIRGILKLTSKYDIDIVKSAVARWVEDSWPKTYQIWFIWSADVGQKSEIDQRTEDFDDLSSEPVSAIRLAWVFGILSILPAAFYQLAITQSKFDWIEVRCDTTKYPHAKEESHTAHWSALDRDDYARVVRVKDGLIRHTNKVANILHTEYPEKDHPCVDEWRHQIVGFSRAMMELPGNAVDTLGIMHYIYAQHSVWRLCAECVSHLESDLEDIQKSIWKKLPRWIA